MSEVNKPITQGDTAKRRILVNETKNMHEIRVYSFGWKLPILLPQAKKPFILLLATFNAA